MKRPILMRALVAFAAIVAATLAAPSVARAAPPDHETGPNFTAPADLTPEAAAQYKKAVTAYKEARKPQKNWIKRINEAIKEIEKARDKAPKFAAPRYYLGVMYSWTGEYDKARQQLKVACDLNPSFHQAMTRLADVYWSLKDLEKAKAEVERAIAANKEFGPAYHYRGILRLKSGDAKGALADLEAAAKNGEDKLDEAITLAKREAAGYGWKETFTCETANYVVLTPVGQGLADDIGKHAELINKTYSRVFPKITGKEKRKFPIIVFADEAQYKASGGPESAGGHYIPLIRKLYLYQYESDDDTKLVLYHEGFHQYLHDYLENAPQWFDEGLGDFFGPSKYVPPKADSRSGGPGAMRLRPNPWRLQTIQAAIQAGKIRHFADLMLMSREEMYDPEWAGIHYAQAWSIIYFLVRGGAPPGKEAGPHFKILQDYFKALRRGDGWDTAFVAAFGNDSAKLDNLMREWIKFTMNLREEE